MNRGMDSRTGRACLVSLSLAVLSLAVLALHAGYYMPFIADDALISMRYAHRLLQGHGLTWTDGKPVEGYSNLLWVLLTAALGRCGLNLVDAVRLLGFASSAMIIGAIAYCHRAATVTESLPMIAAMSTVVLAAPIAVWTIGGLESILVAGLFTCAVVLCYPVFDQEAVPRRYPLLASVALALICITRPDGALLTAAVVLAIVVLEGINSRTIRIGLQLVSLPLLFWLGQLAFRLAYYGEWLPNTALVKLSPSLAHTRAGGSYVVRGFLALSPLSAVAVLSAVFLLVTCRDRARRPRIVLLTVPAVTWSAYVVAVGGDIFPAWRHFVPLIPLMALMLAEGTRWLQQHLSIRFGAAVILAVLAVLFAPYCWLQFTNDRNRTAAEELWEWHGQVVGLMLKKGFGSAQPLIAVDSSGCVPYWSELPAVDMLGLNDYYLPRHPPESFGQDVIGHELGDGQYVLSRQPDLINFTVPEGRGRPRPEDPKSGARYLSGRQMQAMPEFYHLYTLVKFQAEEPERFQPRIWGRSYDDKNTSRPGIWQSLIWVRRYSEKIGIRESDGKISVPGYLLNGNPQTAAYLDDTEKFVVSVSPGRPAVINNLALSAGAWRIEVDASSAVHLVIRPAGQEGTLVKGPAPATFVLPEAGDRHVDVTVESLGEEEIEVRNLQFFRASCP